MRNLMDVSTPAKRFRLIAFWEAVTWLALLVAMVFKWALGYEEAVMVPGMLHGITGFSLFVVVTLFTARSLRWGPGITLLALVSSVPPFGSVVFERWAVGRGLLAELSAPSSENSGYAGAAPTADGGAGARA